MCDQLQDKSFSWERRFKIAVYKWKTRDNTRDSQTTGLCVLKWLTDSVTNLYKSKIDNVYYWRLCTDILKSLSNNTVSVYITQSFIKVMMRVLQENMNVTLLVVIGDCLSSILGLDPIPSAACKIEIMLPVIVTILNSSSRSSDTNNKSIIIQSLQHITSLVTANGNPKKMFTNTCKHLLSPSLSLLTTTYPLDQSIQSAVYQLLLTLFTRDHLEQYMSIIVQDHTHNNNTFKGVTNYTSFLITELRNISDNDDTKKCGFIAIPLLLKAMINQNRIENHLSSIQQFQVFMLFLDIMLPTAATATMTNTDRESVIISTMDDIINNDCNNGMQHWSYHVLTCIHDCLEIMLKENIYELSDDSNNIQFNYLVGILLITIQQVSIVNTDIVSCWYNILSVLLSLNYQLILPYSDKLWIIMLIIQDRIEEPLPTSMIVFYSSLVQLHYKLHQVPVLTQQLLNAVTQFINKQQQQQQQQQQSLIIHHDILKSVQSSLVTLPVGHCLEIIKQFRNLLMEKYRPLWEGLPVTGKRKRRSYTPSLLSSKQLINVINCVINIISNILRYIPLDVFDKGNTSHELVGVVNDIFSNICIPFMETANDQVILQAPSLYLYVTISRLLYSVKTMYPDSGITGMSLGMEWEQDSIIPRPIYWTMTPPNPYSPLIDILMRQYCMMSLRYEHDKENIERILDYLTLIGLTEGYDLWDGQVLTVTEENHCIAIWCILLQELPVISHYINNDIIWTRLALFIILAIQMGMNPPQTGIGMSSPQTGIGMSPRSTSIGMETMVNDLLSSPHYLEMRFLHIQLMSAILLQAGDMWPNEYLPDIRDMMINCSTGLSSFDIINYSDINGGLSLVMDKDLKKLTKFINLVPVCLKVLDSIPVHRSHVSHVTQIMYSISSLLIAVKVAITTQDTYDYLMADVLRSLCQLLYKVLSFDMIRKLPSLHELLPWLLDMGVLATKRIDEKLLLIVLVAMEKMIEYQLHKGCYPLMFIKLLRKRLTSSENEFIIKCFTVVQHVSSTVLHKNIDQHCNKLQKYKRQLQKCERYITTSDLHCTVSMSPSGCGLNTWTILYSNLISLLRDVSLNQFLSHQQIFCYPLSINNHTPNQQLMTKWLMKLQQHDNDDGWVEFVGVARLVALMMRTIEECQEEDMRNIFDNIMSHSDDHSVLCWFISWLCVLESDIKHVGRMILTKYITKVMITSVQHLINLESTSNCCHGDVNMVMIIGLRVLELLAKLPTKIGLNPRAVMVLLNVFSGISIDTLNSQPLILLIYQQLLISLLFNYATTLSNCSAVVLVCILKCLQCNILLVQQSNCHGNDTVQVLTSFSRLIEVLSQQEWFNKSTVYCIGQYIVSSQKIPMDKKLKVSLQSSLLLLLQQLTDTDKNYLLASMEEQEREVLNCLYNDYNKYYRFKGRV